MWTLRVMCVSSAMLVVPTCVRPQLAALPRQVIVAQPQRAPAACVAPANRIEAENCKAGSDPVEWDVIGAGDPTIQGFSTEMSTNVGAPVHFKIKTHSPAYRIDVYRLGYYGGRGARLVDTIRPSVRLPQAQPECLTNVSTRLVDCGNWQVSASWRVPSNGVSGVYLARLVRENADPGAQQGQAPVSGLLRNPLKEPRASHIIFVVRDDERRSDILLQTSDATWQAANSYGGCSLDGCYFLGMEMAAGNRAFKVSYNRPLINRGSRPGSFHSSQNISDQLFNAEYPLLYWLESNGYDVTYFAGVDTERRGGQIKNHKIFMTAGHDAYWSRQQRRNLEAARDAGVHLAFFSGSDGFWKTRWESSIDEAATLNRTVVCYKETHAGAKIDPEETVWTGTWRDSRPFNPEGPNPENALIGTLSTVGPWRNDPLIVPAEYGQHRFWRNTAVAKLRPGGAAVLGSSILGFAWNQDIDNGFRPGGLTRLSETVVDDVAYLQDWGSTYDNGTAAHHLTLYRAPSGALVFSAGAIQWSWGLADFHDNPTGLQNYQNSSAVRLGIDLAGPVTAIAQATVNLLADMGAQPASLRGGLQRAIASADITPPASRIEAPAPDVVADAAALTIEGTATDLGGGIVAAVEISTDGGRSWRAAIGREVWRYQWTLQPGTRHATILSRAIDDSANVEVSPARFTLDIRRAGSPSHLP